MFKNGYVYLLCDGTDEIYKIGKTKQTIEKRIKELQTGNPHEIYIVNFHQTKYPTMIENMFHKHFSNNNVLNEWFSLTNEEVAEFSNLCEEFEKRIEALKDNPFFQKMLR